MKTLKLRRHFIYWILPVIVVLPCILIYFFNPGDLAYYIAPPVNREFGILENLQLILIAVIGIVAWKGIKKRPLKIERQALRCIVFLSAFMFLEEIDYGLHYYEYFTQQQGAIALNEGIRNVHNNGDMNNIIKMTIYFTIVIFFVLLPLVPKQLQSRFSMVRFFAPSVYIIATAITLLVLNHTALLLYHHVDHVNQSLTGNISEFEEVMIYYIFLLYIWELIHKHIKFPLDALHIGGPGKFAEQKK